MRSRIITLLAACLLAIGFGSFLTANPAYAAGDKFCFGGACLNAWNGGPYVNVYTGQGYVANDTFAVVTTAQGYKGLYFFGGGTFNDECIADYNNNSGDARAGLYGDCFDVGGVAWGANFTIVTANCGAGTEAFKNVHWGGYLAPAGNSNGDAFYLNSPSEHCFSFTGNN